MGVGAAAEECRRGLKMRTTTSPKMRSKRRKMHFRLPVFFWYLSEGMYQKEKEGELIEIKLQSLSDENT